jgi:hypothetical protein
MVSDTMSSRKEDRAALVIVELLGRVVSSKQYANAVSFKQVVTIG